jgi:ribonucleotide reductase alpha subunit
LLEIVPEWHLRVQAAVQRHVDATVSKTINLPPTAGVDEVRAIFLAARRAKVKGITVYRDGTKPSQVLTLVTPDREGIQPPVQVDTGFAGRLRRPRLRVLTVDPGKARGTRRKLASLTHYCDGRRSRMTTVRGGATTPRRSR